MAVEFGVLGALVAHRDGGSLALKGPRHRAVLARLLVARGRMVPTNVLIDDLWEVPPADPVGSIRTFVAALRRALEPDRRPRTPSTLLVTEATGYCLRTDEVDAIHFTALVTEARSAGASAAVELLPSALRLWRGPAYVEVSEQSWAMAEINRLTEQRLQAIELLARARLELGRSEEAVPELEQLVLAEPNREEAWRLLALALYRTDRQVDALSVLRRARAALAEEHGLDPSSALVRLENDILRQVDRLDWDQADRVWNRATDSFDQVGTRVRLESTVDLLRRLAVTGGPGLTSAAEQRLTSIAAAERTGDTELTARVIGAYDVPAIWTRSDDPDQARAIVAAAERALLALPADAVEADRARLLATIAMEARGVFGSRGPDAAHRAEAIARRLADPALLAFALNGVFLQSFHRAGQAICRNALGAELIDLATRSGLPTYHILGELICLQARSALGDVAGADLHAESADRLAQRYESPLVAVFTTWYRAFRLAVLGESAPSVAAAYQEAASTLTGSGMPGLSAGLPALAQLAVSGQPDPAADYGPYRPWVEPLLATGAAAARILRQAPEPPPDQLREVRWCLLVEAAIRLQNKDVLHRAHTALAPGRGELAGGGSGLITLGPIDGWLARIEDVEGRS